MKTLFDSKTNEGVSALNLKPEEVRDSVSSMLSSVVISLSRSSTETSVPKSDVVVTHGSGSVSVSWQLIEFDTVFNFSWTK